MTVELLRLTGDGWINPIEIGRAARESYADGEERLYVYPRGAPGRYWVVERELEAEALMIVRLLLLTLNDGAWIAREEIRFAAFEPDGIDPRKALFIYHRYPPNSCDRVARDCELDVCRALRLEMPPPIVQPVDGDAADRADAGAEG